jgi:hypothetical protein
VRFTNLPSFNNFLRPLKFHRRASAPAVALQATSKNAARKIVIERPSKRDRQVLQSPHTIISKQLCSQEEQPSYPVGTTSKNAAQKNKIKRPPKTDRQIVQSPKTVAKPLCMQQNQQSGCSTEEVTKCSDHCFSSMSKLTNESSDLIPVPPISQVVCTNAFHTGSNVIQKHEFSAKNKLCIVPVHQTQICSEISRGCLEQPKMNEHQPQVSCGNATLIPAPSILMPARLISRFEAAPHGRQTPTQTRSIGIQVELQPIGDIKMM